MYTYYLLLTATSWKTTHVTEWLGVLPHSDGVKVVDTQTGKIIKTRDAYFDDESNIHKTPEAPTPHPAQDINTSPWLYPELTHPPHVPSDMDQRAREEDPENQPDLPMNQLSSRKRAPPDSYRSLQAYSASLERSPTYKLAISSTDK